MNALANGKVSRFFQDYTAGKHENRDLNTDFWTLLVLVLLFP